MKIYINGRFYSQPMTGVQKVGDELTKSLDKIVGEGEFELVVPGCCINIPKLKNIKVVKIGNKASNYWVQVTLPMYAKRNGAHILSFGGMPSIIKPDFFFLHDVGFLKIKESYKFAFRTAYYIVILLAKNTAKRIYTVSNFSREEISSSLRIPKDKIITIYNACSNIPRDKIEANYISKFGLKVQNYYLCVGSKNIHKNQNYIYRLAKNNPDRIFVIIGLQDNHSFRKTEKCELKNVVTTGYVSEDEINEFYRLSKGFIFPSLYEGFGIPPLEAIFMGVARVAVSDIKAHKEVYTEGVYFFDPKDERSFSFSKFDRMVISEDTRKRYMNRFDWDKSANNLYSDILNYYNGNTINDGQEAL